MILTSSALENSYVRRKALISELFPRNDNKRSTNIIETHNRSQNSNQELPEPKWANNLVNSGIRLIVFRMYTD